MESKGDDSDIELMSITDIDEDKTDLSSDKSSSVTEIISVSSASDVVMTAADESSTESWSFDFYTTFEDFFKLEFGNKIMFFFLTPEDLASLLFVSHFTCEIIVSDMAKAVKRHFKENYLRRQDEQISDVLIKFSCKTSTWMNHLWYFFVSKRFPTYQNEEYKENQNYIIKYGYLCSVPGVYSMTRITSSPGVHLAQWASLDCPWNRVEEPDYMDYEPLLWGDGNSRFGYPYVYDWRILNRTTSYLQ